MKRILIPAMAIIMVSCATVQPVIDALRAEEEDCKGRGGAYVFDQAALTTRCVMPDVPPSAPGMVDAPAPPSPPPAPPPPAAPPTGAVHGPFAGGAYYEFPRISSATAGEVTFSLRGLDGSTFPRQDGWLFMLMGRGVHGGEANLQMHIYNDQGRGAQIRLISQRFGDPACLRGTATHCESADGISDMYLTPDRTYYVRIWWDERRAGMTLATAGAPTLIWSGRGETQTWGAFASVDWVRVGNGVYPGRPGQGATLTVINPQLITGD